MICFKIINNLFAVLGVLLAFLQLFGYFKDKDRIDFLQIIKTEFDCKPEHPGAQKFLKSFVYEQPKFKNIKPSEIAAIIANGDVDGPEFSKNRTLINGSIVLQNFEGKTSKSICSLEELRDWSKETPLWAWLAWSIIAITTLLDIVILMLEWGKEKRNRQIGKEVS